MDVRGRVQIQTAAISRVVSVVDMNGSMASASATSSRPLFLAPSACPSSKKTAAAVFRRRRTVSCRATGGGGGGGDNDGLLSLPRRDMMLNGLSGVAAGLAWYPGLASGVPVSQCQTGADKVNEKVLLCTDPTTPPCPLQSKTDPIDFNPSVTRVRQPVHLLSPEYQEKYKDAVGKMKELPESNPLSFKAQAAIHQAYCDSYYKYHKSSGSAASKDDPVFDVHFSWIFAPWHRMYIYFYEKALGDLIGDSTFAMPYWNWDAPEGMVVPPLFKDKKWTKSDGKEVDNPLYDPNRNQQYLDKLVDLDYQHEKKYNCTGEYTPIPFEDTENQKYKDLVHKNLCTVYAQQVGKGPESFLGEKYCTDLKRALDAPGMGTLERMAHTAMHVWVGKAGPTTGSSCTADTGGVPNHSIGNNTFNCQNDMGFLGSAANDPLFYSHHSNVDRMWHLWSTMRLGGGQGITDPDWLDTSFVFYDNVKNPRKVRVKVRDVLNTSDLGYTYAESDKGLLWLEPNRKFLVPHDKDSGTTASSAEFVPLQLLQCKVEVVPGVVVPRRDGTKEQLLVIDGIEFNPQVNNKFDVAINVPSDKALEVGPQYMEYAGSFAVVPGSGTGETRQCRVCLCITNVLSAIKAKAGDSVNVVVVPRTAAMVTLKYRPTIKNRN